MIVDVAMLPSEISRKPLRGKTAVVIDVLRASTTIVHALSNGAREVRPFSSVAKARQFFRTLPVGKGLLCGERKGKRVAGFDLGNSPLEYRHCRVAGKSILLATTNGTKAMEKVSSARCVYVACFLNILAVARQVSNRGLNATIVCSGKQGGFSLEDFACAGMLVATLRRSCPRAELTDSAQSALILSKSVGRKVHQLLRQCNHGQYLSSIGMARDLAVCARANTRGIVPTMRKGRIVETN